MDNENNLNVSTDSPLTMSLNAENTDEIVSQDTDSEFDDFYFFWDPNEIIEDE